MPSTLRKTIAYASLALGLVSGVVLIFFGIIAAYQLMGGWGIWLGLGAFPLLAMGGAIVLVWIAIGEFPWLLLVLQIVSFAGIGLKTHLEEGG